MTTVTKVNKDSMGYPGAAPAFSSRCLPHRARLVADSARGRAGPPSKPKEVDPATAELWRSLGIHVPPTVLRESRENHERSLHGALTAIAFKLDKLTAATELNAQTMAEQYARQD